LYELFEWGVAVVTGDTAESFLGTQGYMWDTQSDMAMAMAMFMLSRVHDKQLRLFPIPHRDKRLTKTRGAFYLSVV
jgi:putative membrane protein